MHSQMYTPVSTKSPTRGADKSNLICLCEKDAGKVVVFSGWEKQCLLFFPSFSYSGDCCPCLLGFFFSAVNCGYRPPWGEISAGIRNKIISREFLCFPLLNVCSPMMNIRFSSWNIHSPMENINFVPAKMETYRDRGEKFSLYTEISIKKGIDKSRIIGISRGVYDFQQIDGWWTRDILLCSCPVSCTSHVLPLMV